MQARQTEVSNAIRGDGDVLNVVSVVGSGSVNPTPNVGRFVVTLRPRDEKRDGIDAVLDRLKQRVVGIPGVRVYFLPVQDIQISTRSSRSLYQYTLTAADADEVGDWSDKLVKEMFRHDPIFRDVSSEGQEGGLRAFLNVDRERAGQLGVSLQSVNDTLNDAFGQRQISTIYGQANQYRVVLEALPHFQTDPTILSKLYVPGAGGVQVPITTVATLVRTTAPLAIAHQPQFPSMTISFNLAPDYALGQAVDAVKAAEKRIGMPGSIVGLFSGDAAEFSRSLAGEPWLLLAAVVMITYRARRAL